jgi:hypothetical protein
MNGHSDPTFVCNIKKIQAWQLGENAPDGQTHSQM